MREFGPSGESLLPFALLLLLEDKRAVTKQDALDEEGVSRREFDRRSTALAALLATTLRANETAASARVARLLDQDWRALPARRRGDVLREAARILEAIPQGVVGRRLTQSAIIAAMRMDRTTREDARQQQQLNVRAAPTSSEESKAARFARPTSDFIAQEYTRRSRAFAGSAAVAIGVGLRLGESNDQITARVRQRAAVAVGRDAYLAGVAGAVLNRARNNSLLNVYREAGATSIQVLSARDERTCEKCLFMHGTIFPVEPAFDLMSRTSLARTPSAVANVNPFLREGVAANGDRVIYVPGGDGARLTLGTVIESRQGQVDRVSRFDRTPNPIELLSLGIGLPPYHPI